LRNRFLALTHPLTASVAAKVRAAGRRFGIGAIGRPTDPGLPIDPQLVYAQYARLGATAALLARVFVGDPVDRLDLAGEVAQARACLGRWYGAPEERLLEMRDELARAAGASQIW
jgi:hypothetical protein